MKKIVPFRINIYTDNIANSINCQDMANQIIEYHKTQPSENLSNKGGWQSQVLTKQDTAYNIISPIVDIIMPSIHEIFLEHGIKKSKYRLGYWFNINRKYNYNTSHNHLGAGSLFSAVVW